MTVFLWCLWSCRWFLAGHHLQWNKIMEKPIIVSPNNQAMIFEFFPNFPANFWRSFRLQKFLKRYQGFFVFEKSSSWFAWIHCQLTWTYYTLMEAVFECLRRPGICSIDRPTFSRCSSTGPKWTAQTEVILAKSWPPLRRTWSTTKAS